MAKDNLFLGFGRGKVGDVVFYRSNGTQITRARNRNPRNPNSVPQRVVRAVNASVSRLYSIGQEIFNHAFEGAATPADNQRKFNSLNINLLRGLIADDLNSGRVDGACLARVGARGLSAAVPFNGMQLSSGKLPNNAFEMKSDGRFGMPDPLHSSPGVYTETVAEYATRIGLVEGDIYTFVMIGTPGTTDSQLAYYGAEGEAFNPCAAIFPFFFNYAQLIVKAEAFTNINLITTGTKLSAIFGASDRGIDLTNQPLVVLFTPADIDSRMVNGVAGCIHSRESTGLRSTTFGIAFQSLPGENSDWGLTTNYLAQAWQTGDSNLRGDELVLDGKYFVPSGVTVSPKVFDCEDNHQITAVGIGFIPGTVDGVACPAIPVVVDDQGNNFFIKNTDTEMKSYNLYLKQNGDIDHWGDQNFGAVVTGATTANTVKTYEKGENSWWTWLIEAGISPYVILEET